MRDDEAKSVDLDILDQIIAMCEAAMVGRVSKKKKPAPLEVPEELEELEEESLEASEEEEPEEDKEDDASDDEMDELLEAMKRKGRG